MTIANPIKSPKTTDPKEIDRFYQELAKQFSYHVSDGSPAGSITPRWVGDWCLDATNSDWYRAYGLANTDWKSTTD